MVVVGETVDVIFVSVQAAVAEAKAGMLGYKYLLAKYFPQTTSSAQRLQLLIVFARFGHSEFGNHARAIARAATPVSRDASAAMAR